MNDVTELKVAFQQNVKRVLKVKGISQRDLARRLNVSDSAISELLNGNYGISLDYVDRVAKALGETNFSLVIPTIPEEVSRLAEISS
jgi:transcriptional regulator with XRE-family HTH domain